MRDGAVLRTLNVICLVFCVGDLDIGAVSRTFEFEFSYTLDLIILKFSFDVSVSLIYFLFDGLHISTVLMPFIYLYILDQV